MSLIASSLEMRIEKMNLLETGKFSSIFLDYINRSTQLEPFYNTFPTIENFEKIIGQRNFDTQKREVLFNVLYDQYRDVEIVDQVHKNLGLLKDNKTFTITTGHQLNICTGPLYFIYKIATVINACKSLAEKYPDHNFVPVYWMASEDHDFEEIDHFRLFGKKYQWETDQFGAVGRFDSSSMGALLSSLPEKSLLFEKAYLQHNNLADATRYVVNELFGEDGIVVIDADNSILKSQFKSVIKDDVINQHAEKLVTESSEKLSSIGYKTQVFPRPINFFYLEQNSRERIIPENGKFRINNTDKVFDETEIIHEIENRPECFSPNVILRPLYQEVILPNIAYIGGPSEVAYWFQLKSIFEKYKVDYPVLMPRNFALVINTATSKKMKKLGISSGELFKDSIQLKKDYVANQATLNPSFEREKEVMTELFSSIKNQAIAIDKSLEGFIGAEENRTFKTLENIEKRIRKAEESKHEQGIKTLMTIKEKLFPGEGLQERTDNFLNFYFNNPEFITQIKQVFDPFDFRFHIITEDE